MVERRASLEDEAQGLLTSNEMPGRPTPLRQRRSQTGVSGLIHRIARSHMP